MKLEKHFDLVSSILHLNHAGIAPWPRKTVAAIHEFARENAMRGTLNSVAWKREINWLRKALHQLIGASSPDEIALTKNTSEGISIVAYGLQWRPGDNVVVGRQEFPSNRLAWESLARRFDTEVRLVDIENRTPEQSLIESMDGNTRLLAVSAIQYAWGSRIDLARLGEACRRNGTLLCVDAIQHLGAAPFDAQAVGADFVCADGHKWLLSPEGSGIFYCRRNRLDLLRLNQFGWHMTAEPNDFERPQWRKAPDATRFECGSLNHMGFIALAASLKLLNEIGLETVFGEVENKITYLIDGLDENQFEILTPKEPERRGGILTVRCHHMDRDMLFSRLSSRGVLCAKRAGGIRLSPHFYTPQPVLDEVLEICHRHP